MTCKDCIHSGLCYKENDYKDFPERCGSFGPPIELELLIARGSNGVVIPVPAIRQPGEWLWVGHDGAKLKWSCPSCGRSVEDQENFCPDCGRRMKKEEKNENT